MMADIAGSVRELLDGERLERAEENVASLMEPIAAVAAPAPLLEARRHLDERLNDACPNAERAKNSIDFLTRVTAFGELNDPTTPGSELLWLRLLERLLPLDVTLAASAASAWNRRLFDLSFGSDASASVLHRPLAAFILGTIEAHLGHDVRAERWLEEGQVGAEIEETENGVVTFLRACRIVREGLRGSSPRLRDGPSGLG
jgi:hypothetical protein